MPSTLNPQPSTLKVQPSTVNPQLSSFSPPSTLNLQPSPLTPKLSTPQLSPLTTLFLVPGPDWYRTQLKLESIYC